MVQAGRVTDPRAHRPRTERGLERLVFFTDAVAAIAITLLALPLVDVFSDVPLAAAHPHALGSIIGEHWLQFVLFVLTFLVIGRLWFAHHQLFEHVERYTTRLVALDLLWALTIVALPIPSAAVALWSPTPTSVAFYIGTMTLSELFLTGIAVLVQRDPEIGPSAGTLAARLVVLGNVATLIAFALAMVLGMLVPVVNYAWLWLIALTPIVERPIRRRWIRADAARAAA